MTGEALTAARERPLWLTTLADLALLLVGFFVFLQANQADPAALAAGFRAAFAADETAAMPVELAVASDFLPGSAELHRPEAILAWAAAATRDPRTTLRISGEVDGTAGDVDPQTGSGPILAADRARAVAALLVRSGAAAPQRIHMSTARGARRAVLTLGYDGGRQ